MFAIRLTELVITANQPALPRGRRTSLHVPACPAIEGARTVWGAGAIVRFEVECEACTPLGDLV